MNLADITTKCYILALIIRDDGERILLGDGAYEFKDTQQHFQPNTFANDVVELQGTDGQMLAGQVRRTATQTFSGYIGDATFSQQAVESARRDFMMFFRKQHFYTAVYIFKDGTAIQRKRGYIVDAPSVPELWQKFPEWSIGLNFEDPNYYEYAENNLGEEIYAHIQSIDIATVISGGLVWDAIGATWDSVGAIWEEGGSGGITTVTVDGVDSAEPIWTVTGPATNPTLTNITTGQTIEWTGTVPSGQTLIVNMDEMTASLEGANVFQFITGSWVTLQAGNNRISYSATGATDPSTLSWNGVVG